MNKYIIELSDECSLIIANAQAAWRRGEISAEDWNAITRRALKDIGMEKFCVEQDRPQVQAQEMEAG